MLKSKWFKIDKVSKTFISKRDAKTLKEAWDKTIEKWALKVDRYSSIDANDTCGMCNLFSKNGCMGCVLHYTEYGHGLTTGCVPFLYSDEQYLFLLFVREATS